MKWMQSWQRLRNDSLHPLLTFMTRCRITANVIKHFTSV